MAAIKYWLQNAEAPRTSLKSCSVSCRKPRATLARPDDAEGRTTLPLAPPPRPEARPGGKPGPRPHRGEERATPAHPATRRITPPLANVQADSCPARAVAG